MSGERDPLLAAELARRPVFEHRPGFWDDLERELRSSAPSTDLGEPRPDLARPMPGTAGPMLDTAEPPVDRGGTPLLEGARFGRRHRRPRSPSRAHRGRWLLAAAIVLIAGGLAGTLVADQGDRTTSISTDDPVATTQPPVVVTGGGPPVVLDRDGRPLSPDLAVRVALATVDDLLATDPRYLGGADAGRRAALLADGGLTVRTTIDGAAQRSALDARANAADNAGAGATITAVDPSTGAIVVAVDDDQVADSLFRRSVRLDGAVAPMLLAAAFDRAGVLPDDTIDGRGPCEFSVPGGIPDPWKVQNPDNGRGAVDTVRQQMVDRSSCAWVRLGMAIGVDTIVDTGVALGVTTGLQPYPSLPLGTAETSVVDLTSAYATLAAGGVHREPYLIESVSQGDQVLYQQGPPTDQRAVSADTACRVTSVLASVRADDEPAVSHPEAVGISGGAQRGDAGLYVGYSATLAATVSIEVSTAADPDGPAAAVWNQFLVGYSPPAPVGGAEPLVRSCPEAPRAPQPVEEGR